jgi:polysaccharide biosynthesis protein PslA
VFIGIFSGDERSPLRNVYAIWEPMGVLVSIGEPKIRAIAAGSQYSPPITAGLVSALDVLAIIISGNIAFILSPAATAHYAHYLSISFLGAGVVVATFKYLKLYNFDALVRPADQLRKIVAACGLSFFILYFAMLCVSSYYFYAISWRYSFVVISAIAIYGGRWATYGVLLTLARRGLVSRNLVIIGGGQQGVRLIQSLRAGRQPWTRILGVFDDRTNRLPENIMGCPKLGTTNDLIGFVRETRVDDVLVALPWTAEARINEIVSKVRVLAANIHLSPDLAGHSYPHSSVAWCDGIYVLNVAPKPLDGWSFVAKVIEDKIVALFALIVLLPIFALAAIAIKLDSPGPIFFRQKRFGFNGALIDVYKFRTMYHDKRDNFAETLTTRSDTRVTRVGHFLRRLSIDELPQLLNVLEGSMSVVGPRPHPIRAKAAGKLYNEAVEKYAERQKIRPGITGWAQVNGWRGETNTEEKLRRRVECDIYYIENWSILFDIRILLLTIVAVLLGNEAY